MVRMVSRSTCGSRHRPSSAGTALMASSISELRNFFGRARTTAPESSLRRPSVSSASRRRARDQVPSVITGATAGSFRFSNRQARRGPTIADTKPIEETWPSPIDRRATASRSSPLASPLWSGCGTALGLHSAAASTECSAVKAAPITTAREPSTRCGVSLRKTTVWAWCSRMPRSSS